MRTPPDVTSGARRYNAAMKWREHRHGDMLLAVGIVCALADMAWLGLAGGGGNGFWSGSGTGDTTWAF